MLDKLTDSLSYALRNLRGKGRLTQSNMETALEEVRRALLSADVHYEVVKDFIKAVSDLCLGQQVLKEVSPGQQVTKIIHDQLIKLLGEGETQLFAKRPLKVMMVGLQGAGKTTSSAKLAKHLRKQGYQPHLVACDVYRPAAIDQLETLASSENLGFSGDRNSKDVPLIGKRGLEQALSQQSDLIIFDTAGRLQINEVLIDEIKDLKYKVQPDEIILVADSALGQEAVNVAKTFHQAVGLTGIMMTKLDGDARGGAAVSMKALTGVPIKFIGTGEKIDDFSPFHPDRMASRILGMGDVVSLVEKAQDTLDAKEAERNAKKVKKAELDFEDMLSQFQQVKKMGSMGSLMKMIPGMSGVNIGEKEEQEMKYSEAIILSMTRYERKNPRILNSSRRSRIASGSGTSLKKVNQLLKQHQQMKKMMKGMKGKKNKKMMRQMEAMGGGMPDLGNIDFSQLGSRLGSDKLPNQSGFPGLK